MESGEERQNPISVASGEMQYGVDPIALRPSREDLIRVRPEFQRSLIRTDQDRFTPISVSQEGVIIDGHHAVRAAAEERTMVDVLVATFPLPGKSCTILDLVVR